MDHPRPNRARRTAKTVHDAPTALANAPKPEGQRPCRNEATMASASQSATPCGPLAETHTNTKRPIPSVEGPAFSRLRQRNPLLVSREPLPSKEFRCPPAP